MMLAVRSFDIKLQLLQACSWLATERQADTNNLVVIGSFVLVLVTQVILVSVVVKRELASRS